MRSTVGIIGGGQLARMTHQAAISLGVRTVVLCPDPDAPAIASGATHVSGRPDVFDDLVTLAEQVDVVTVEHEQTPVAHLERLARLGHRVAPGAQAASLGQNKTEARRVLAGAGVATAPWISTADAAAIGTFGATHGWPVVLKAPHGGYDGRGVWVVGPSEVAAVVGDGQRPILVEPLLPFTHELSVLVVRSSGVDGRTGSPEVAVYPPFETVQHDGQCVEVCAPAGVPPAVAQRARSLALTIAETVDLVGTMAVELFVVPDPDTPDGSRLLLNELAVRPHNSGHLTIEACATSQFENHLRAVLGWPLGSTDLRVGAACMRNIVGPGDGADPFDHLSRALTIPGASVHHYAKSARPGRKLGHVTATAPGIDQARATAQEAVAVLATDADRSAA